MESARAAELGLLPSPLWGGVGGGGPSLGRDSSITARPPPRALTRATLPTRGEGRTECAALNGFQHKQRALRPRMDQYPQSEVRLFLKITSAARAGGSRRDAR